jgi:hypothetical protein
MKKFLIAMLFVVSSFGAFAGEVLTAEKSDSQLQILDLVVSVKTTYSKSSELEAKVVELLGGDGMNPTRMVLVFNNGYDGSKVFELGTMMYEVTRITFSDIDTVVINFTQDSFDNADDMNPIQVKKSIQVKAIRDSKGQLTDKAEITELK